jgi:hypothetical protein
LQAVKVTTENDPESPCDKCQAAFNGRPNKKKLCDTCQRWTDYILRDARSLPTPLKCLAPPILPRQSTCKIEAGCGKIYVIINGDSKILSCADAVAKAIKAHIGEE